jgi:hypothetical protein
MSSLDHSLPALTYTRLSVVTDTAANLIAQLSELNELRDRVRKAELASRRRFTAEKRARIRWPELRSR